MLNENDDMDELFRRASDGYPLNTASNDWSKVREGIEAQETETGGVKKGRSYKSLLLLLLLLPLVWICNNHPNKNAEIIAEKKADKQSPKLNNDVTSSTTIEQQKEKSKLSLPKNSIEISKQSTIDQHKIFTNKTTQISNNSTPVFKRDRNNNAVMQPVSSNEVTGDNKDDNKVEPGETLVIDRDDQQLGKIENKIEEPKQLPTENKTVTKDTSKIVKENITAVRATDKEKKFYAGLIGFGEVSTIRFQKVKHPGIGLGILVGYKLSKKISIETGAYAEKKYYYTIGKYFNPKTPYTQPYTTLLDADGNCKMVDVPLNLKYNFKTTPKYSLSLIAGLSSYFMSKENYDYKLDQMGMTRDRYIMYTDKSNDWAAVVNAGISYEKKISKKAMLRVEPNIKLPLRGVGYGRIKMLTTGLNVGVTKDLF